MARDLGQGGAASLVGQPVASPADLASAAETLRKGEKEVARTVLTRDGRVVAVLNGALRLPGVASFALRAGGADPAASIRDAIVAHGADGYFLLHNQPSGDPMPSSTDLQTTARLAREVPGFGGHVVLDGDRYGHIDVGPDGGAISTVHDLPEELHRGSPGRRPLIDASARTPEDLIRVAATLGAPDGAATLLAVTPGGRVGDVRSVGTADLLHALSLGSAQAVGRLRRFAIRGGSSRPHLVLPEGLEAAILGDPTRRANLRLALGKNLLADVVTHDGRSLRTVMGLPRSEGYELGRGLSEGERAYAVREPLGEPDEAPSLLLPNGERLIRNAADRRRLKELTDTLGPAAGTVRYAGERFASPTDLTILERRLDHESNDKAIIYLTQKNVL